MSLPQTKSKQRIRFSEIRSPEALALALGITPRRQDELVAQSESFYTKIRLRKKSGRRRRIVYRIEEDLAAIQRHIARSIAAVCDRALGDCVHGFRKGRSTASNAKPHCDKKLVLCVDLKNFFESIPLERVKASFQFLQCHADVADKLARLCTLRGHLPAGASTSPILSNLAAQGLDSELSNMSAILGCAYTRYGDDLTFSGDQVPAVEAISAIARTQGFTLNPEKTRLQPRGRPQYVTGLTVCDPERPRIPRRTKKNLRLALHYATTYGFRQHTERSEFSSLQIHGLALYVNAVEPNLGRVFIDQCYQAYKLDTAGVEKTKQGSVARPRP